MRINFVTRSEWFDMSRLHLRPRANDLVMEEGEGLATVVGNHAGGGMQSKYLNVAKACPDAHFVGDFNSFTEPIAIFEPLLFWGNDFKGQPEYFNEKRDALEAYQGLKLLWAEEQTIFRWFGYERGQILEQMHGILVCNEYQEQLVRAIAGDLPVLKLYTPIDENLYRPRPKKPQVVAIGKVGLQKNVDTLIEFFKLLGDDVHKIYIGNAGMWGQTEYDADPLLEREIASVVDEHIPSATASQVARILGESLCYINVSLYDVGCLSFLEASLAGCWAFCWEYHLMFDEYSNVVRFADIAEAREQILERVHGERIACDALRDEVLAKHSFSAFRENLESVVKEVIFDAS